MSPDQNIAVAIVACVAIATFVSVGGFDTTISAYKSDPMKFIVIVVAAILAVIIGYTIAFFLGRKVK